METSASFEARSAPSSYPTVEAPVRFYAGGRSAMLVPTASLSRMNSGIVATYW
jgi:hypothetical protein